MSAAKVVEVSLPKPTLASYAGVISRWCALTGNVPEVSGGQHKAAVELERFNQWLDDQAAEARRMEESFS